MKKSLEKSNLQEITKDNLSHGRIGLTDETPSYSFAPKWKWYGDMKVKNNPLNERRYDLKLTGRLWRGLSYKVDDSATTVEFYNKDAADYIQQYQGYFGIDQRQMEQVQLENKPEIRKQLESIISGT